MSPAGLQLDVTVACFDFSDGLFSSCTFVLFASNGGFFTILFCYFDVFEIDANKFASVIDTVGVGFCICVNFFCINFDICISRVLGEVSDGFNACYAFSSRVWARGSNLCFKVCVINDFL